MDKQGLKILSLMHSLSFIHTRTHINKNTSSQSVTPDWPTMFLRVISVFRTKGFYLLLKDDRVCVGVWVCVCLCMCMCVCPCVCFGRIIRPCALLPESFLTTGLSHNESTLSRTLDTHTTHMHMHAHTYTTDTILSTFTDVWKQTHTLCKCLTGTHNHAHIV